MTPSRVIDPTDRLRIETAVLEAERCTAGEIVVNVVAASDEYGSAGWRLGVLLAALAFLGIENLHALRALAVVDLHPVAAPFAAQALALFAGHALARIAAVRRLFISEALADVRVRERARRAFGEHGLVRTRGRTGILIFVSLLEHRVVVLADEGIHAALSPEERWEDVVALVIDGIRAGRLADGLVAGVARCGEILASHVPIDPGRDVNELPNALVLED